MFESPQRMEGLCKRGALLATQVLVELSEVRSKAPCAAVLSTPTRCLASVRRSCRCVTHLPVRDAERDALLSDCGAVASAASSRGLAGCAIGCALERLDRRQLLGLRSGGA